MRTEHVQGIGVEKVTGHQYLATYSMRNFFFRVFETEFHMGKVPR